MKKIFFIYICAFLQNTTASEFKTDEKGSVINDPSGICEVQYNSLVSTGKPYNPNTVVVLVCNNNHSLIWEGTGDDYQVTVQWIDANNLLITHPEGTTADIKETKLGHVNIKYVPQ